VGLDDRDYMRERHRNHFNRTTDRPRPFSPPEQSTSLLLIIGFWMILAFVLYKGYGWWQDKQQDDRAARQAAAMQSQMAHRAEREPQRTDVQESLVRVQPTTRSAAPAPVRALSEDSRQQSAAPSTGGTIFLCKAYNGGTFWAQAHCNQHNALIDSMVSVPAGLPFEQQVQIAQQHRQAMAQTIYAAPAPDATPDPSVANRAQCKSLDARVEQLDAMARQPHSAQTQDWIRGERKAARDRQFALRC
jgi:hypothetical protein